jgi:hypothetical protein
MQTITTKFLGATDTKGSRISARTTAGHVIVVPYPHEASTGTEAHSHAALALARRLNWSGTLAGGSLDAKRFVFVFTHDTFSI